MLGVGEHTFVQEGSLQTELVHITQVSDCVSVIATQGSNNFGVLIEAQIQHRPGYSSATTTVETTSADC